MTYDPCNDCNEDCEGSNVDCEKFVNWCVNSLEADENIGDDEN